MWCLVTSYNIAIAVFRSYFPYEHAQERACQIAIIRLQCFIFQQVKTKAVKMAKFGEPMRGLMVFIQDIRACKCTYCTACVRVALK